VDLAGIRRAKWTEKPLCGDPQGYAAGAPESDVWLGVLITGVEISHTYHFARGVRFACHLWLSCEETPLFPAGVLMGVARGPRGGEGGA
jgi:hypothetical protein